MQNIGGENAGDAFYRYKMPKLVAKIEGRGNGIKTNVVNNVEIAKALERPPEYILKFYGCELGAQTNFDKGCGTSIVNGAHDQRKLNELLEAFIKKYVQCYSCGNPETTVKVKREMIYLKCKACGYVSEVDPRHKVNTFILKNPPENKLSKEERRLKKAEEERMADALDNEKREKKEKKDKKDKKDKKSKKGKGEEGEGDKEDGDEDANGGSAEDEGEEEEEEVVWLTDTSEAAVRARAAEQLTAATAAMVTQGNLEAEAAEAKRRADKEAKKRAAEEDQRRRAALESGERLDVASASALLAALAAEGGDAAVAAAVRKLNAEGGAAGRMAALYGGLFGGEAKVHTSMSANTELLRSLAPDAAAQLAQLVGFEHLFCVALGADRLKEAPLALKHMYDSDLAEEEIIVAWAERADAGKVVGVGAEEAAALRAAVAPVVEWLQEADEDDSEEEEDEE